MNHCPYCGLQDPILTEDFEEDVPDSWAAITKWLLSAAVVVVIVFLVFLAIVIPPIHHLPWPL